MALPEYQPDEPLSPVDRLFLQWEPEQIINCALLFKSPIHIPNFKSAVESSPLVQNPRFRSLPIRDRNGTIKWQKNELNLNKHIIVVNKSINKSDTSYIDDDTKTTISEEVNAYLADLSVSNPLSYDKPLWEIHILVAYNCVVLRVHHALSDGMSLMSLLQACFEKSVNDPRLLATCINGTSDSSTTTTNIQNVRRSFSDWLISIWFTILFSLRVIGRILWIKDVRTVVDWRKGLELWTRKLATASFSIEDLNDVKSAIPNATNDDVLYGIVSIGLSRYLDLRIPKGYRALTGLLDRVQGTGLSVVHLIREEPGLQELKNTAEAKSKVRCTSNKVGLVLLPIKYHKAGSDPLQLINRIKVMLDRKKQSFEAQLSYLAIKCLTSIFSEKVAGWVMNRIISSTSFSMSNIIGPSEEMSFAGNTITSLRINLTSLPHAITMNTVRYAGKVEMQILTAKAMVPNPELLAKCFEDALAEMKDAVTAVGNC